MAILLAFSYHLVKGCRNGFFGFRWKVRHGRRNGDRRAVRQAVYPEHFICPGNYATGQIDFPATGFGNGTNFIEEFEFLIKLRIGADNRAFIGVSPLQGQL